ncbi:dual specificity phosphatase 12 [Geosmithia morbida]|uniref:protein-tyrosine-phosphatase n=1 Tax=Geosmithia morbida TaxID=1094350 RepID=A0A9P4YUQ1_9HYPO|nr:dual specificity phosphatase 12 [Geosmithia morbida]KAF4122038.1 dual specificity phosphatase 12 [Geosmithia morbida]
MRDQDQDQDSRLENWETFGHEFGLGELENLKRSIVEMALSRIDGPDDLYVGGIWALRRSDSLAERRITHVLSMIGFNPAELKNFKEQPWSQYGKGIEHLAVDIDDVDDANLLIELPRAVRFIDSGLRQSTSTSTSASKKTVQEGIEASGLKGSPSSSSSPPATGDGGGGAVFVHCAAGKSRSVSAIIAYLLYRYPNRFDPNIVGSMGLEHGADGDGKNVGAADAVSKPRRETAREAVRNALAYVRRTRPMAEPNDGFMSQLELWWQMGCPVDGEMEEQSAYQRWAYQREVEESLAAGQAPTRLRFEDEEETQASSDATGPATSSLSLRCKRCRRALATGGFVVPHKSPGTHVGAGQCQHLFIEPLGWMRPELEKGQLNGRLLCPNEKCAAAVGRYDWKGFKCSCAAWVTPAFSLQRARVDDVVARPFPDGADAALKQQQSLGIRMPPGSRSGNL